MSIQTHRSKGHLRLTLRLPIARPCLGFRQRGGTGRAGQRVPRQDAAVAAQKGRAQAAAEDPDRGRPPKTEVAASWTRVVGSLGVSPTTSVLLLGISPFIWGVCLWEALAVVSQQPCLGLPYVLVAVDQNVHNPI